MAGLSHYGGQRSWLCAPLAWLLIVGVPNATFHNTHSISLSYEYGMKIIQSISPGHTFRPTTNEPGDT